MASIISALPAASKIVAASVICPVMTGAPVTSADLQVDLAIILSASAEGAVAAVLKFVGAGSGAA
jgi:hypothetical protein